MTTSEDMNAANPVAASAERRAALQGALRVEYISIAWKVIEAVVGIASAIAIDSLALLAFGIDSVIELASACVLVWRLNIEYRRGQDFAEQAERRASLIAGVLLLALAAYVVLGAGWKLWMREGAEFSWPGLIVAALALPVMYFLARRKLKMAETLKSRALRADAVESIACGWLSLVVVVALLVQAVLQAWWVDAVASLGIVWFLVREGREALKG